MVTVVQRVTQYNSEVKQPRGGFVNPNLLKVTQLDDGLGALDQKQENLHASVVGMAVDYLARLDLVRIAEGEEAIGYVRDIFQASLMGAERITDLGVYPPAKVLAAEAAYELRVVEEPDGTARFVIDEEAVRIVCKLSTYDMGLRGNTFMYNPESSERAPDEVTVSHILTMVERARRLFDERGPVVDDTFLFMSEEQYAAGERGGYTDLVDGGDGDFLTADTVWDFKVSVSKPTKDHTLQLLMYFLMGKASGLPKFATQTHIAVFNPRLNTIYRLAVDEIPADVIDVVRRDVIGYTG
ncbi:hypothetical protein [Microbacterium sp.]|uniref:hypothetical protein n=1 Tax=Microbacterium sp. TaxID=51671 RepID=UPI0033422C6B